MKSRTSGSATIKLKPFGVANTSKYEVFAINGSLCTISGKFISSDVANPKTKIYVFMVFQVMAQELNSVDDMRNNKIFRIITDCETGWYEVRTVYRENLKRYSWTIEPIDKNDWDYIHSSYDRTSYCNIPPIPTKEWVIEAARQLKLGAI